MKNIFKSVYIFGGVLVLALLAFIFISCEQPADDDSGSNSTVVVNYTKAAWTGGDSSEKIAPLLVRSKAMS